tara:strand:- start:25117 stop:27447 length:2331 start_codon:yes stop_codon:yes gene_type:complete
MKRGISPLLATVLLIALVIVLAAIIMIWLGNLVDIETAEVDQVTFIDIELLDVTFDDTAGTIDTRIRNNEINQDVENIILRVTPEGEDMIQETFDNENPVLPALFSNTFSVSHLGCPESVDIEVIPQIVKNEVLYSLLGSTIETTKEIDCESGGTLECTIDQVYWEDDPGENVIVIEGSRVQSTINPDGCDGEKADLEIYECIDDTCEDYIEPVVHEELGITLNREIISISWDPPTETATKYYAFEVTEDETIKSSNILQVDPKPEGDECINQAYWSELRGLTPPTEDVTIIPNEETVEIKVGINLDAQEYCEIDDTLIVNIYECTDEDCDSILINPIETLEEIPLTEYITLEWIPTENSKRYTFRAELLPEQEYASNVLHTAPADFLGACDLTITEDQDIARTLEPIILTYPEIEEKCPDISLATESSIRILEEGTEITSQVDDWNSALDGPDTDLLLDSNDEILFLADMNSKQSKEYELTYNFIEQEIPDYGADTYKEDTKEFWYGEREFRIGGSSYFGKFEDGGSGVLISRQETAAPGTVQDNDFFQFLGSNSENIMFMNGPVRARIYSESEGNIGVDFKASVTYDIYPDREAFITSEIEWLSDCTSLALDNCFYIKLSTFPFNSAFVAGTPINYEHSENGAHAPFIANGPGKLPNLPKYGTYFKGDLQDSSWISMASVILSQNSNYYTSHIFDLKPGFDNVWDYINEPNINFDRLNLKDNTNSINGKTITITAWVSNKLIERFRTYDGTFQEIERTYENPLKVTIQENEAEL